MMNSSLDSIIILKVPAPTKRAIAVAFLFVAAVLYPKYNTGIRRQSSDLRLRNALKGNNFVSISKPLPLPASRYTQKKGNCRRRCSHYANKIYYAEPYDGGLDDRISAINALANLATYLCAELVLKPPSELLQPYHNNLVKLDDDLVWHDFLQASLQEDNSQYNLHTRGFSYESESKYQPWLYVVTTDWRKAIEDFKQVQNASFEEESNDNNAARFLWEIRQNWWMVSKGLNENIRNVIDDIVPMQFKSNHTEYINMLPTESNFSTIDLKHSGRAHQNGRGFILFNAISSSCTYVTLDFSNQIKLMQRSMETEIRELSDKGGDAFVGLLHLRRGDTTNICDTSPEKLRQYLQCSLGGIAGLKNVTLIMTSEEKDLTWRSNVMSLSNEFSHVTIIDGDDIAQRVVALAAETGHIDKKMVNNFVVFAVEGMLRDPQSDFINFRLIRRRSHCNHCDPNAYQALDPTKSYRADRDKIVIERKVVSL